MVGMATHLHKTTGMKNLCMAGGVALNSVANTRILKESGFREYVCANPRPAMAGGALGAALWAYNTLLGNPATSRWITLSGAVNNSDSEIGDFLTQNNIPPTRYDNER